MRFGRNAEEKVFGGVLLFYRGQNAVIEVKNRDHDLNYEPDDLNRDFNDPDHEPDDLDRDLNDPDHEPDDLNCNLDDPDREPDDLDRDLNNPEHDPKDYLEIQWSEMIGKNPERIQKT